MIHKAYLTTPLGFMISEASEKGLLRLEFIPDEQNNLDPQDTSHPILTSIKEELSLYFQNKLTTFQTPLECIGTPFQKAVWEALRTLDYGTTCSYAFIAQQVGRPSAYRAVAQANRSNPLAIIIPCHRVIYQDGSLGGYAGGLWRKQKLLTHEQGYS